MKKFIVFVVSILFCFPSYASVQFICESCEMSENERTKFQSILNTHDVFDAVVVSVQATGEKKETINVTVVKGKYGSGRRLFRNGGTVLETLEQNMDMILRDARSMKN